MTDTVTQDVHDRWRELYRLHQATFNERAKIRAIMTGGEAGLRTLLGNKIKTLDHRIPSFNMILSGLTRLGQKLGRAPDVSITPPRRTGRQTDDSRDAEKSSKAAEQRERYILGLDDQDELELQLLVHGRWLAAYGFMVGTLTEEWFNNVPYVHLEPRDPIDCFPGFWGATQHPQDMAVRRVVPIPALKRIYGEAVADLKPTTINRQRVAQGAGAGGYIIGPGPNFENQTGDGEVVVEFYDSTGIYVILPSRMRLIDHIPNKLSKAPFIARRRPTIGPVAGQYDQVIGLQGAMTRINMLALMAVEDGVNTETNISGDQPFGGKYKKGRDAVNVLPPGTRVDKPINQMSHQVFQEGARLEQQLRMQAGYPIQDDAVSPHDGFITGQGLGQLQNPISLEVREYQKVMASFLREADYKRLEWEEAYYGDMERVIYGARAGEEFAERVVPSKDINGEYRTRRIYGVMAGWDEAAVVITGLQLLAAGAIDLRTFQENLDGVVSPTQIDERNRAREIERGLMSMLAADASGGNPTTDPTTMMKAKTAMIQILKTPEKVQEILEEMYLVEGEELEQLQAAPAAPGPLDDLTGLGQPPAPAQVLARLAGSGPQGGSQTINRIAR